MQKTVIIHGPINRQYGETVSVQLNKILDKHPEYSLQQVIVLYSTEVVGTLLCVLENKNQNNQEEQEYENHYK